MNVEQLDELLFMECPYCGDYITIISDTADYDVLDNLVITVECMGCSRQFEIIYKIVGIKEI